MPGVTKEQIERAKEWDLLSYLQTYEPHEVKRCGGAEYRTVTHDSLKISNGKWHWHSRGIGGRTALDYLIKVKGMGFVAAVETLCGEPGAIVVGAFKRRQEENIQKLFSLPEKNRCGRAMVSYLQGRGIDADIISQCIGNGRKHTVLDHELILEHEPGSLILRNFLLLSGNDAGSDISLLEKVAQRLCFQQLLTE